jgi:hypothetical protein
MEGVPSRNIDEALTGEAESKLSPTTAARDLIEDCCSLAPPKQTSTVNTDVSCGTNHRYVIVYADSSARKVRTTRGMIAPVSRSSPSGFKFVA